MKIIFNYDANKTHFHNKGFALSLVLKVRFFGTRKWPIAEHILSYIPAFTIWTLQISARNLQQSEQTFQLKSSAVISFSIAHSVILYFNNWENWFSKPTKKKNKLIHQRWKQRSYSFYWELPDCASSFLLIFQWNKLLARFYLSGMLNPYKSKKNIANKSEGLRNNCTLLKYFIKTW